MSRLSEAQNPSERAPTVSGVADILAHVERLPVFPDVAARALAQITAPDGSAQDLEKIIATDASLTTEVLRLANSALFGVGREVGAVRQAITVLGTRRLFDIVAGLAFASVLPERLPGYEIDARDFWRHSLAVAVFSEELAVELLGARPGLLFTAGLLHDMGKLAVSELLLRERRALRLRTDGLGLDLDVAERDLLGATHAEVGGALAERWRLPSSVVAAARWHHSPLEAPDEDDLPAIGLVHIADGLAHSLGFGADIAGLQRRICPDTCRAVGVTPRRLEAVAARSLDSIEEMAGILSVETGGRR